MKARPSFEISDTGEAITCLLCGPTSHNRNDVEQKYCGYCHVFHGDVERARRARELLKMALGRGEFAGEMSEEEFAQRLDAESLS